MVKGDLDGAADSGDPAVPGKLDPLRRRVMEALRDGLARNVFEDLAFIGNSSSIYSWTEANIVDIDAFIFVDELTLQLGEHLLKVRQSLDAALRPANVEFELRIIEGPYKPAVRTLTRPVILAHLAVFTETMYRAVPPLKRWGWRKYRCERVADRLARLAPAPPDLNEVLSGAKGVSQRLAALENSRVDMLEWILPTLQQAVVPVTEGDANFAECCFAYSATCARNHCRGLALKEADSLSNEVFFPWYSAHVFSSDALAQLMELKMQCRRRGFDVDVKLVKSLAIDYLRGLETHLKQLVGERPAAAG